MGKILSSIGLVILVIELINVFKWIEKKSDTKLYDPDFVNNLDYAEKYLKNRNRKNKT